MRTLNRTASELLVREGIRGATDITGFGLLGHAAAVARESRLTLELDAAALPLLPGVLALALRLQAGGLKANRHVFEPEVEYVGTLDAALAAVLYDPQTSGGLFLLVPELEAAALVAELAGARVVGHARPRGAKALVVRA